MGELIIDRPNGYEFAPRSSGMDEALLQQLLSLEIPSEQPTAADAPLIKAYPAAERSLPADAEARPETDTVTAETTIAPEDDPFAAWEAIFAKSRSEPVGESEDEFDAPKNIFIMTSEDVPPANDGEGWLDDLEKEIGDAPDIDNDETDREAALAAGEQEAGELLEAQFQPVEQSRRRLRKCLGTAAMVLALAGAPLLGKFMATKSAGSEARLASRPEAARVYEAPEFGKTLNTIEQALPETTTTTVVPAVGTAKVDLAEITRKLIADNAEADRLAAVKLAEEKAAAEKALQEMAAAEKAAVPQYTGNKYKLMEAAGIPESDWYYVDCVIAGCEGVQAEGGWDGVQTWNYEGSGAYGICQAQPAGKMASAGSDYMTNIVTQLKWCDSYAKGYGGWKQAWDFRKCTGYCYSPRTGTTVYKDHTWW